MIKLNFLKRNKKLTKNNILPDPNVYWLILFSVGFLLIILSLAFGWYSFLEINQDKNISTLNDSEQLKKISPERIEKVLEFFLVRERESEKILNSYIPIVDPSL